MIARQFGSMTEKVADYEKLLRDLATRVSNADAQMIKVALEKVGYLPLTPGWQTQVY
jgi:hypothetical protein